MALADVCGFQINHGNSHFGLDANDPMGMPTWNDAMTMSENFTVPCDIDVCTLNVRF